LENANISFQKCIDIAQPVDMTIVYSDFLIARSGSLLFSPKYSLYPSIKNLAKNIFVIAFENHIVPDLKTIFEMQENLSQRKNFDFFEIITPTNPVNDSDETFFSSTDPMFILFLISQK
jgi:hypothetical protein